MKLVFASNNTNKIKEIQQLVPASIQIVSLQDIGCTEDIPETADTIEGNAILKANYVTEKYGLNCFADDSGLEVAVLNEAPGVHSARYAGASKNDDDNMNKLLFTLKNETHRIANFKTVICSNLDGNQHLFTGKIFGEICTEKKGSNGFGYDPIFLVIELQQTFGEIPPEVKAKISHRAEALALLRSKLKSLV